jgi:FixJ family two-component response regulator
VAAFKKRRADVVGVLLDLTMPHMDGQETFRELRAIDPNVRVLLSSGYGEQELERRFAGQTLAGFIQKPYELQSLGDALRAAFGG